MEMEKKFFQVNVQKLEINEVYLDINSEYFKYAKPWTFENEKDATEYLRQQLNILVEERKQLVNTILTL